MRLASVAEKDYRALHSEYVRLRLLWMRGASLEIDGKESMQKREADGGNGRKKEKKWGEKHNSNRIVHGQTIVLGFKKKDGKATTSARRVSGFNTPVVSHHSDAARALCRPERRIIRSKPFCVHPWPGDVKRGASHRRKGTGDAAWLRLQRAEPNRLAGRGVSKKIPSSGPRLRVSWSPCWAAIRAGATAGQTERFWCR